MCCQHVIMSICPTPTPIFHVFLMRVSPLAPLPLTSSRCIHCSLMCVSNTGFPS